MSVNILTAAELGVFVGLSIKLKLQTLSEACDMAAALSESNCAAYFSSYGEIETPCSADDIEREAIRALALPTGIGLQGHFGSVLYNCVDQSGNLFFGNMRLDRGTEPPAAIMQTVELWRGIEKACRKHQEQEAARIRRQAEDDESFADVGPLPVMTADELRAEMTARGAKRLIVAQFNVDTSDLQSDYHGNRSVRHVIIGFGTGSRESFPQMRKAAAMFPPTADYAPGFDVWTVSAYKSTPDAHGRVDRETLRDDHYNCLQFSTKAQAEEYVRNLIETAPECQPGYSGCIGFPTFAKEFGIDYRCESLENRENYSMGGGNYLGRSRYSGWQVYQTTYFSNDFEFFDAPPPVMKKTSKPKAARTPAAPVVTLADHYAANV